MQKWIILGVIILIVIIGIVIVTNIDIETEYIPESEVEEVELRKTIVSLYFIEKETGKITKETKLIDSKELLKNPYEKLVNMLLEGPQNQNLEKILPENVSVLETNFESGIVTINFSNEFSEIKDKDTVIEAIEKTLKELTEVDGIKILIDGNKVEENKKAENVIDNTTIVDNTITTNTVTANLTTMQNTAISE